MKHLEKLNRRMDCPEMYKIRRSIFQYHRMFPLKMLGYHLHTLSSYLDSGQLENSCKLLNISNLFDYLKFSFHLTSYWSSRKNRRASQPMSKSV